MLGVVAFIYGHVFDKVGEERLRLHLENHPDTEEELGECAPVLGNLSYDYYHGNESYKDRKLIVGILLDSWACYGTIPLSEMTIQPTPEHLQKYQTLMDDVRSLNCLRDFDFGDPIVFLLGEST